RSDDFYWQKNAGTHPHSGSPHGRKRLALATAISCAAVSRTFHLADRLGNLEAGGPGVKWAEHEIRQETGAPWGSAAAPGRKPTDGCGSILQNARYAHNVAPSAGRSCCPAPSCCPALP